MDNNTNQQLTRRFVDLYAITPQEAHCIARAFARCADETGQALRSLALVYLQGMCSMLTAQKRITRETMNTLLGQACSIAGADAPEARSNAVKSLLDPVAYEIAHS